MAMDTKRIEEIAVNLLCQRINLTRYAYSHDSKRKTEKSISRFSKQRFFIEKTLAKTSGVVHKNFSAFYRFVETFILYCFIYVNNRTFQLQVVGGSHRLCVYGEQRMVSV